MVAPESLEEGIVYMCHIWLVHQSKPWPWRSCNTAALELLRKDLMYRDDPWVRVEINGAPLTYIKRDMIVAWCIEEQM